MKKKIGIILIILVLIIIIAIIVINIIFKNYNDYDANENIANTNITNNELVDTNSEDIDVRYNYTYGEIFKIENNTIFYGEVKEENNYLSLKLSENYKVINYENEELLTINDIEVGDYVSLRIPTEESQNAQPTIIVAKKDYIIDQVEKRVLNKRELSTELEYYNEAENYIIVGIYLERKIIEGIDIQPLYNLYLSVGKNTKTYLGWKENNPNSNYGYHLHELCTVELESEITDLSNKNLVKAIEFIAD